MPRQDINIRVAGTFSQKGKRRQNEDAYFLSNDPSKDLYFVCDGVGGANKGEFASSLVVEKLPQLFEHYSSNQNSLKTIFDHILEDLVSLFSKVESENIDSKGLATTLALLGTYEGKLFSCHIGDSRIYQFRKGEIVFKTKDHSLVNSLLDLGRLTPQELEDHPCKNVILRAICSNQEQVKSEINYLDQEPGDCFLLCSDGVLEAWGEQDLISMFSSEDLDLQKIMETISEGCKLRSRDNYTAILLTL